MDAPAVAVFATFPLAQRLQLAPLWRFQALDHPTHRQASPRPQTRIVLRFPKRSIRHRAENGGVSDLFASDPERAARNAQMNDWFLSAVGRGEHATGGVAVLSGVPEPIARLNAAQEVWERAQRSGDDEEKAYAEHLLDTAVEAAREARQEREQPRDPETGQYMPTGSFDGGVRGGARTVAPPAGGAARETSSQLFARMLTQSRHERAESGADQTLIAQNI
jgi:hypothetical protein